MGSLFRSEPMTLCQLFLQPESAYSCLSELGELGLVQFKDLNQSVNAFQRKFVNEVRRCEEMERKLRFLEKEIVKDKIAILDTGENPEAPASREMSDLEVIVERLETEMKDINSNSEALKRNFLDLTELRHILSKTHNFFEEVANYQQHYDSLLLDAGGPAAAAAGAGDDELESVNLLRDDTHHTHRLSFGFVAGVILRDRLAAFERMLWRACRGNVLLRHTDIDAPLEDPVTGADVYKSVFLIFFQGDQLKTKVRKICEGFHGTVYPCPETQSERREMAMGVVTRIEDLRTVINQTEDHRYRVLGDCATNLRVWNIKVRKMKAIYHTLNQFSTSSSSSAGLASLSSSSSSPKSLIGECWCPVKHLDVIHRALRRGTERSGSGVASILNVIDTSEAPPTYHMTNKFTAVFQNIVDAYGVASYREANAAPFAVITFPFLFSVMFGDCGHGLLMLIAASCMVVMERRLERLRIDNEIWKMFFGGRYIILLMGAFSVYSGLLYNDVFSKSFNVFGSAWYPSPERYSLTGRLVHHTELMLDPKNESDYSGDPYAFGIDPAWQLAINKISFLNSFKMKISVIFGVSQMLFGIMLSYTNHRYFNDRLSVLTEFLPQTVFLLSIFGYLILLIVYKWFAYDANMSPCAPSLLIGLINMFLLNYPSRPCAVATFYTGQRVVQTLLLLVIVACVPWMLLPKPLILRQRHRRHQQSGDIVYDAGESDVDVLLSRDAADQSATTSAQDLTAHQQFEFSEVFVHQCIHTIEYCLGCISHTASYLRLWALSLAHAELSEVLWNMILHLGFSVGGPVGSLLIFVLFVPWAVLTVAILLVMEGLSAFLHTLRLHWVEFMSKFYGGEGYTFEPFSFEACFTLATDE